MTHIRFILLFILTAAGLATAPHKKSQQFGPAEVQKPCIIRSYGTNGKKVCVCNATYCDTIPRPKKMKRFQYILYTSNEAGLRFDKTTGKFKNDQLSRNKKNVITVNPNNTLQEMKGWGGAFTDSTGINIKSLPEPAQELLMKSYFSEEGIEYSLCRVPIGGTDFSTHPYTYDDSVEEDPNLENFALAKEDLEYKIRLMKKALQLKKNESLKFFASPWMAPKWMKTNNDYSGVGLIKKDFYQTWAQYFVKFLEKYKEQEIAYWGVTTQNEATMTYRNVTNFGSNGWTSIEMTTFLKKNLGPTMHSSFPDTKIMILDDHKYFLPWYTNSILQDKEARKYASGIAIHWYYGTLTPCSAMTETHEVFPDKFILSTEACNGFENSSGVDLGSWEYGENYSTDIIENTHCWVVGWVDWNMVLNLQGGPSYINNFVDAPIIVNSSAGEFYKQPMFYIWVTIRSSYRQVRSILSPKGFMLKKSWLRLIRGLTKGSLWLF